MAECHSVSTPVFTDGSRRAQRVGFAVISLGSVSMTRPPPLASIYTAELAALDSALSVIHDLPGSHFTFFFDSRSALQALRRYQSPHPLILQIRSTLGQIC